MASSVATKILGFVLLLLLILPFHCLCEDDMSVVAPMEKAEMEALFSVIAGFAGDWWKGSGPYGLYNDPCGFTPVQGVSCDFFNGTWYITAINIGPVLENSLECSEEAKFSPSLFNLSYLKTLSLFNCFTSTHTTIPSLDWQKLSSTLETLELRSNRALIGKIPSSFGLLTNLKTLVLVENSLSGEIPRELGNLVHLKRLSLEGNEFSGNIPWSFGYNLSDLLILDLSRNYLTGPLPSSFGSLTSLLKLDLSNNMLNGNLPKELENMKNLTLLDLRNNNLSYGLPQSLQKIESLQDLLLSNNPFLGGNLMEFKFEELTNLRNLDLSNLGLKGMIPESITKLKNLRFIALDNNHLSGSIDPNLESLPSLHGLHLHGNDFSGELEFSDEFYLRMGRRFAAWNNRKLCYKGSMKGGVVPYGVDECSSTEKENLDFDSKNKVVDSGFMASFGLSDSSLSGFWWVVLVQEMMVVFVLVLFL